MSCLAVVLRALRLWSIQRDDQGDGGEEPEAEQGGVVGDALVQAAGGVSEQDEPAGPDGSAGDVLGGEGPVGHVAHP